MTDTVRSACVLCSQNCGLLIDVEDNKITKVEADEGNPFTRGYSCNKAYRIAHYVDHRQRVKEPLKRQPDGSYAPISWDQAIDEIGGKLRSLTRTHGPDSFALLGVGGQGNHLSVPYALSLLIGTGSRWWFNALAQEKTQRALVDGWMVRPPTDVMLVGHIEESDYAVILGSNPALSQRGVEPQRTLRAFKKDPLRTLVVVDPRNTETARQADRHLAIKVGADVYFLLAFAAIIVEEGLYDRDFVSARTLGFDAISAVLKDVDVDEMASRCALAAEVIRTVAREFSAAKRACLDLDLGLEQSRFNTLTAYLIRLIMALTDNLGRAGGSVYAGSFTPRLSREFGTPKLAPGSGIRGIALMAPVPMFSPALFAEEVLTDRADRIRAVIVEGSNPVLTYPESPRTRAAFDKLDLSVVIDPAFTETARLADYVLPAPVNYEKWEMSGFPKPFPLLGVQVRPPVVEGPKGALPEPEIYHRIALRMGLVRRAPRRLHNLARHAQRPARGLAYLMALGPLALLSALGSKRTVPTALFWLYETLGPTLRAPQLAAVWGLCQGVAWTRRADVARESPELAARRNPIAVGNQLFQRAMAHPEGAILGRVDPEKSLDDHIGYDDGRIRLAPAPMLTEIGRALQSRLVSDPDYPFVLNGGMRTHWTANTNFRDPAWRKGAGPHCALRINVIDAVRLGLKKGDLIRVRTRVGMVELPVAPEKHVQPGHVHIPNGFGGFYPDAETGEMMLVGVNINELTDATDRDPFTGCPHHKYVRCRIEPVTPTPSTPVA